MGIEVQLTTESYDDWDEPHSALAVDDLLAIDFRLGTCDHTHAEEQALKEAATRADVITTLVDKKVIIDHKMGGPITAADLYKAYKLATKDDLPESYVVVHPELAHLPKGDVARYGADVLIDDSIAEYEEEAKQQEATTSKRKQITKQIELTFIELEDTCKT